MEVWLEKGSASWSDANSEPCKTSMLELKVVTSFDKSSIMFDKVLKLAVVDCNEDMNI